MKDIFKIIKTARLSVDEKASIREAVLGFAAAMPRQVEAKRGFSALVSEAVGRLFIVSRRSSSYAVGVFLLILLAGSGVSYAAEGAAPGDALYPVKVGFNENLRGMAAVTAVNRADWEVRKAERRLEEAEALAARNQLGAAPRAELERRFSAQAARVDRRMAELGGGKKHAAEISSRFESSLRAHRRILLSMNVDKTIKGEASVLADALLAEADAASARRIDLEKKEAASRVVSAAAAAEDGRRAAEHAIGKTKAHLVRMQSRFGVQDAAAETELDSAERAYAKGMKEIDDKAYDRAVASFGAARRAAREAKTLLGARERMHKSGL